MEKNHLVGRLQGMERSVLIIKDEVKEVYDSKKQYNATLARVLLRLKQLEGVIVETKDLVVQDGVQP